MVTKESQPPPGAVRQPKFAAVVGWGLAIVGAEFFTVSLGASPQEVVPVGMVAFIFTAAGIFIIVYYSNWYILMLPQENVQRIQYHKNGEQFPRYQSPQW